MIIALDTSVLVAALHDEQPFHHECLALLGHDTIIVAAYGLVETFSTLTGGRLGFRRPPAIVSQVLVEDVKPIVTSVALSSEEILQAVAECEPRGIRGGAIYDYLHLASAKKAGASCLYTLNIRHFLAFHRPGDPEILHP